MRNIPKCREIIRLAALGYSDNKISQMTGSTRKTVKKICKKAAEDKVTWPLDLKMDDYTLYYTMFPAKNRNMPQKAPDTAKAFVDTSNGSSKKLLFYKYQDSCESSGDKPLKYDQFCRKIREKEEELRITTDKNIKAGEQVITFWLKTPIMYTDEDGVAYKGKVFMGILPYSQYVFAEVYPKDTKETWISAHVKMFKVFGGIPNELFAEKSKSSQYGGEIQATYRELAEYYGTIISLNEKNEYSQEVADIASWFSAQLDQEVAVSFDDARRIVTQVLNEYLNEKLPDGRVRNKVFRAGEKKCLRKLPKEEFIPIIRKDAQVMFNCHIKYESNYYSVPFQYAMKQDKTVQVEIERNKLSIYYHDLLIAEHPRDKKAKGVYVTKLSHMPSEEEALQMEWNPKRFLDWAGTFGPATKRVISKVLQSKDIVQKTFIHCRTILVLGDTYSKQEVEFACTQIGKNSKGTVYKLIEDCIKRNREAML